MQKELFFSIITPTYKRPVELARCMQSVFDQDYKNWEMLVIDDSGEIGDDNPGDFEMTLGEVSVGKVLYFSNKENMGNNFSKNFALEKVSNASDYVIFLDDDDWLHTDALKNINKIIQEESEKENLKDKKIESKIDWLVTNRSVGDKSLTKNKTNKNTINYFWDYLMLKKFSGDATHVMRSEIATQFRFSSQIKNGEEVFYFLQIPSDFFYENINTTNTNGYAENGMTADLKGKYKINTNLLWKEKMSLKLFIYLLIRTIYFYVRKN